LALVVDVIRAVCAFDAHVGQADSLVGARVACLHVVAGLVLAAVASPPVGAPTHAQFTHALVATIDPCARQIVLKETAALVAVPSVATKMLQRLQEQLNVVLHRYMI
jgi:hypothetical protein